MPQNRHRGAADTIRLEYKEREAGGAAWRLYPNDIRDNRRRDGREGERIVRAKRDKNKRPIAEIGHEGLIRLWPEPNKKRKKKERKQDETCPEPHSK